MIRLSIFMLFMFFSLNSVFCQTYQAIDGKQYWFSEVFKVEKGIVVCGDIDIEKSNFKLMVNGSIEQPVKAFIWKNSDGTVFYRVRLDQGDKILQFFNEKKFLVSTDSLLGVNLKGMLVSGWVSTPKEPFQQENVGPGLGVLLDASETDGSIYVSTVPTNFMGTDGNFYDIYYFWNGLQPGARVTDGIIIGTPDITVQGKVLPKNTGIYFQLNDENYRHIPFIGNVNNLGKQIPSKKVILLGTLSGEEYSFDLGKKIMIDNKDQLVTDGYVVNSNVSIDKVEQKVKSAHYQVDENGIGRFNEIEF